jgi:membrane protease YdiL (CAAX protease family)
LLIAGIAALSIQGANEFAGPQHAINRLQTYALTAITELVMVAWIYFGLRLRKVPLGAILGSNAGGLRAFVLDLGYAMIFWVVSLMILGGIGITWEILQAVLSHRPLFPNGTQLTPDPGQQQTLHTLSQLAPTSASEVVAWIFLCVLAGMAEEMIFRGYLQRQFAAWSRGAMALGVAGSALLFGAAHGYQGARNMVLLAIFGALFSILSLLRRGLRPGMMAHGWHDLIAGLVLAVLKAHHVV